MSVTLKASNLTLLTNAEFAYLANSYDAGTSSFVLTSVTNLAVDDYLLFGEFGNETSEILKISAITSASKTITTETSTFAHPESTKLTVLSYNQVRFYRSTTSTDTTPTALATYQDIEADDLFSKYRDTTNTTGFGFFLFYNETTAKATAFSNPIPYVGFGENTVSKIIEDFFGFLNNKEQKIITNTNAMRWLNEAYSWATNELNLVSEDYGVGAQSTITTEADEPEYDLPTDFSHIVSITEDDGGGSINNIDINKVANFRDSSALQPFDTRYYLRNTKIGFIPTPSAVTTYNLYYKKKTTLINSLDDTIDFPNNEFFFLVDFLMYRASIKLNKSNPDDYLKLFEKGIERMKMSAHKRDDSIDEWEIAHHANV